MKNKFLLSVLFTLLLLSLNSQVVADMGPIPNIDKTTKLKKVDIPFDLDALKYNWRSRIKTIMDSGKLPIIDIESSYNPKKLNAKEFAKMMDKHGIALIAFSPQVGGNEFKKGKLWNDNLRRLVGIDPWRYIPTTTAGVDPAWTKKSEEFLDKQIQHVKEDGYPLMGEFEFRHYPSPRQYKRGEMFRDVNIPINGELGHRLFAFSQESGIPFQIHYEAEDKLLPALEEMLKAYPGAKVIWCHLAQIRYYDRSTIYSSDYVEKLIKRYSNIYFDIAFGSPESMYPDSGERQARVWLQSWDQYGKVRKEWIQVISTHPWRFLAAMDLGGDRMSKLPEYSKKLRMFLENFPEDVQKIVAYKATWKLLFNEAF